MQSLSAIKNIIRKPFAHSPKQTNPEEAYDLWASSYDSQPDNLMLALDEQLFSDLIAGISFREKVIADIGCGTGRHWKKMLDKEPGKLMGFDVSEGMLDILKTKFPGSETNKLNDHFLTGLGNDSIDMIISTLTVAHIGNIEQAFNEWNRILKNNGEIIITDYHPEALSKGGNRTFKYNEQIVAVKNNIYPVAEIKNIFLGFGFELLCFTEKKIGEPVKHYYEKHHALGLYEKFRGVPIIYGIHLKKANGAS